MKKYFVDLNPKKSRRLEVYTRRCGVCKELYRTRKKKGKQVCPDCRVKQRG